MGARGGNKVLTNYSSFGDQKIAKANRVDRVGQRDGGKGDGNARTGTRGVKASWYEKNPPVD